MTNSQISTPVADTIVHEQLDFYARYHHYPAYIIIGTNTYQKFRDEMWKLLGLDLPEVGASTAFEFKGMMFSFINSENYLAVR